MNRLVTASLTTIVLMVGVTVQAGTVTPVLQKALGGYGTAEPVPVIIRFTGKLDTGTLQASVARELKQRYPNSAVHQANRRTVTRRLLVERLKQAAAPGLQRTQAFLQQRGSNGGLKSLWAINAVAGHIPAKLVDKLADLPWVDSVTLDAVVQGPGEGSAPTAPTNWNLPAVRAPELWQLGHTGLGVVVATMDTGVDASHPDLGPRWRGGTNSWFDPYDQHATPADNVTGHGTRVLGLIVGGAAGGYQVGMAPDAQWIAAKIFDNSNTATLSGIHQGFQWVLDPDGDPATDDVPDIVNNSWVLEGTTNQCDQEFTQDIAMLKAADIAVVFSGGNFGPTANTSVSPANAPGVIAVGSINYSLAVENQSSRGPSACEGGIYPHLVAPGDGVLTTDQMPGFYNVVSGTSFAVAHLAGGMVLLRSAFPLASVNELETAMINTATDLGAVGPDNDFGHGLLDVVAAHDWLDDSDGDGIPYSTDNCPGQANPAQLDNDGDGQGDICDPDDDNDGLADVDELSLGTDPFVADTDSDGLLDGEEVNVHGTDPILADSDSDGFDDQEEVLAGSDPLDSDSIPGSASGDVDGNGVVDIRDVLRAYRILLGEVVPDTNEILRGDIAPLVDGSPAPDGGFDTGDLLVIQRVVLDYQLAP
jgi:serine protease AprX